jgi:hypothetical protein
MKKTKAATPSKKIVKKVVSHLKEDAHERKEAAMDDVKLKKKIKTMAKAKSSCK